MPRSAFFRRTLIACAAACLALPPAMAAELGEMTVQSHVGQPLLAEVELTALAPEEANGVAVRLASPDVYRGGGIGMDAALQGLTITPVERGGRRYVRVATQQAIQAGHVHLYLLLGNGNAAIVRLATLWLTPPPPTPPTPPTPPVVTAPIKPLSAPQSPAASVPPDAAALAARARAEGMLRPPAVFVAPPAQPKAAAAAIRPPMVVRPPPLHRRAAPVAACAPQADAEACVALEQKNTALNDKLGELEGKIGALQKALAQPATATAALPAAAPAGAQPPHAKPKPVAAPAGEKKAGEAGGHGLLWLGIGTLLFLLLTAAIVYFLRKRKEAGRAPAPSKYWVLLRKPFRRKPAPPVLTEAPEEVAAAAPEPEPFSR